MDEGKELDWLDDNDSDEIKRQRENDAIVFAQNYSIFVNDPRGKALMDHWEQTILRRVTATEAPIQRYAADNAVREFILGIKGQIELAKKQPIQ